MPAASFRIEQPDGEKIASLGAQTSTGGNSTIPRVASSRRRPYPSADGLRRRAGGQVGRTSASKQQRLRGVCRKLKKNARKCRRCPHQLLELALLLQYPAVASSNARSRINILQRSLSAGRWTYTVPCNGREVSGLTDRRRQTSDWVSVDMTQVGSRWNMTARLRVGVACAGAFTMHMNVCFFTLASVEGHIIAPDADGLPTHFPSPNPLSLIAFILEHDL
jgi:hypothetical protein